MSKYDGRDIAAVNNRSSIEALIAPPPSVVHLTGEQRGNLIRSLQKAGTKLSENAEGAVWVQDGRVQVAIRE